MAPGPATRYLPEGAHVHDETALAHRLVLVEHPAVALGPLPDPGRLHDRAQGQVAVVQGRPVLDRLALAGRNLLQGDAADGRASGGRARARAGRPRPRLHEGADVGVAEGAPAGAHRRRRVALEDLGGAEALVPGLGELVDADVLAQADDAPARRCRQGHLDSRSALPQARPAARRGRLLERAPGRGGVAGHDHVQALGLTREPVAGREPERQHHGVAGMALLGAGPRHDQLANPTPARGPHGLAATQRDHLEPGGAQHLGVLVDLGALAHQSRPRPGGEPVGPGQAGGATPQPDAR